jgi:hypothetical protein
MPHFFFHLIASDGKEPDDEGISFPDLGAAKADARSSLLEMTSDDVAAGRAPRYLAIEIADSQGVVVGRVAVDDVLWP